MSDQDQSPTAFEKRARELYDASVNSLDSRTRARLAAARREAVDAATRPERQAWRTWVPVAAAASAALVAVLLWRPQVTQQTVAADEIQVDAALDPVELLANGEDVDLVENDLAFYDWVDATEFDPGASAG
jgi:negative regulator of sigma E activity